jgi:hypothetical protein
MAKCKGSARLLQQHHTNIQSVTNVHLVVNRRNSERVDKHTDVVLLPTEPDTLFYTLSTVNPYVTTQTTSLNTSRSIY